MAQGGDPAVTRAARVSPERLARIAEVLSKRAPAPPDFVRPGATPPPGTAADDRLLDYFFTLTLQQFAFWRLEGERWNGSYIGLIGGAPRKGSDFVWCAGLRALARNPERLAPAWWGRASDEEIADFFAEDDGAARIPWLPDRIALGRGTGEWFLERGQTPRDLLAEANAAVRPVASLLAHLAEIPGYAEDPLRKKAMLLVFILALRPERFLDARDSDSLRPVVDYHVMRTALRTGLIEADPALAARLVARTRLAAEEERDVRDATFEAMNELHRASGASHPALDALFFAARRKCPEVGEPACGSCLLDPACAHRKDLFQPVFPTTAY